MFGLLAVSAVGPAYAGQLGHYFPGSFNIRDYVMPDKGVYAAVYTIHYASDSLRNASGDDISSVSLAGRTVNVDTDLSLYSISPTVIWNSGWKILGPEYGAQATVPFGGPSLGVALSTPTGSGIDADTSTFHLQDLYVQPVWLGWKWPNVDLAASVGVYAPSGRFEAGAADDFGLGFWIVQFQLGAAYYWLQKATAIVLAGTYEINTEHGTSTSPQASASL